MKLFTNLLLAVALVSCLFASCKKSGTKPSPVNNTLTSQGMKYTINGDTASFPMCYTYDMGTNTTATATLIHGYSLVSGSPSIKALTVTIYHTAALKVGDTFSAMSNDSMDGVSCLYTLNGNAAYCTQTSNPQGTLTLTEVTSDHIKGTFSIKLFNVSDENGTTVIYTITSGQFYAVVTKAS